MRKHIIVVVFLLVTIYACKHEVITNPAVVPPVIDTTTTPGPVGPGQSNSVCFENDILPIFKSSCAKSGCHDAASRQDGYILDSYSNIIKKGIRAGNANDSKIYEAITEDDDDDDRMPKKPNPRLSAAQINLIKAWINEGARNTVNCASTCDPNSFKYAADIKPIIDANCLGCHNNATAGAGLNYTTYAGLKAATLNGRLVGSINHSAGFSPMPKGSAKLSDCKITQVTKWVQAGAPNN